LIIRNHSNTFDGRGGNKTLPIDQQRPFTDFEGSPQDEPETRCLPPAAQSPLIPGLPYIKAPTTVPNAISFESEGWISTPLLRRPGAKKATPRSAERDTAQAGRLAFGLIVFLALAATQFFIWLAIRGPALLERISSLRPRCYIVSCETQAQPHHEAQTQPAPKSHSQPEPQPQALLQPQAQPQIQPRAQPPRHPPSSRPHVLDGVVVGRGPQRRSPIECWRDRSIRGPCFD
jgi:hypothetical protein